MIADINTEDRLVQRTFADHLEKMLGWESVYAYCHLYHGISGKYCISGKYLDRVLSMK